MAATLAALLLTLLAPADPPVVSGTKKPDSPPAVSGAKKTESPRKQSPFAPSLPELTEEEEAKLDAVIDRFIEYDTGKLTGEDGKKALAEFQKLGPDATFALIRGLNKAAQINHSCPALVIGKKLSGILKASNDRDLLDFARENIGMEVKESRHMNVLKDLKLTCSLRKSAIERSVGSELRGPK
jgi:hypothetical protein